ncbi:hypothetical protein Tco_0579066 [Tanacetum coccineum]
MRTRNSSFPNNSPVTLPRRRNRRRAPNIVEPELRTIVEVAPMVERTMKELLRAPTEGYGEAICEDESNHTRSGVAYEGPSIPTNHSTKKAGYFGEVLKLKKSNHFSSGSTTPFSDSRPSLTSFETSDSLLEEFTDELALSDLILREIRILILKPILEKLNFCLPPPGDDDDVKGCDLPFCDNKMIFSNPLFGFNDDLTSSDDKFLEEDIPKETWNG